MTARHLRQALPSHRLRRTAGTVVQVALVLMALAIIGLPLATKSEWRTVETGSMRPTIDPGDVILAAPVTTPARVGDMVVFRDPLHADRDIVHRLVGYDAEGGLVTKGDANDTADPWVLQTSDIKGAVALRVPKVGFIVQAIDSRAGILVFLVLPALAILISEGRVWYRFIRYGREAFEPLRHGRHLLVEPAF